MTVFYAYENWRANGHRVTVHAAHCVFCNHGHGVSSGTRADNGTWHTLGEFHSSEDALAHAMQASLSAVSEKTHLQSHAALAARALASRDQR